MLIISYPKYLEGEHQRDRVSGVGSTVAEEGRLLKMIRNTLMWPLLIRSVIYESQVEVVTSLFLQPFLRLGLASLGISIVAPTAIESVRGSGALIVGVNELFCDGLGAVGARSSVKFETAAGDRGRAMRLLYWTTAAFIVIAALCALNVSSWFWAGLVVIGLITMLQNLRRPIYVSALNDVANKPLRATILSIDNQATALSTAALLPLMGFIADRWGLWTICAFSASIFLLGLAARQRGLETAASSSSNP